MAKFKKGDRVRNVEPDSINTSVENYKFGDYGTVVEEDQLTLMPDILWDNGVTDCQYESLLELITEPSAPPETGPAPGTLEHWRWTMAAQAMQGILASGLYAIGDNLTYIGNQKEAAGRCADAVQWADALIAELKGGKP